MTPLYALLSLLAIALAAFASAVTKAFHTFSHNRLEELCKQRNCLGRMEAIFAREEQAAFAAESVRVLFTVFAVIGMYVWLQQAWVSAYTYGAVINDVLWILGSIIIFWAALIWFPTAVARIWSEPLILVTWPLWSLLGRLLAPFSALSHFAERVMRWSTGQPEARDEEQQLEDELLSIVTEGHREGILEEEAREMIESVIELSDVSVAEIMTPRTYMIAMQSELPFDQAVKFAIESGHTRIPVYGESREEIIGILHIKDLLTELSRPAQERRPLHQILRKAFFVPETKKVSELLTEFQRSRNHMAIVLDEYGSVSGVVTIEDAIEEIVGEIADEYDEALVDGIKCHTETSCEALARVRLDELNRRLGLSLPEDQEFDTIGGLVFHELGRIPEVGEELTYDGVKIRVLDASRRRIDRVAIEVVKPQEEQVPE